MAIDRATVIRLVKEAANNGGSELAGDAIERFAQLVFLEAAQHEPDVTPGEALLQRAYEAGWVQCATWAERDDLITDCDSPAYARERDAALSKLVADGVAPSPAPLSDDDVRTIAEKHSVRVGGARRFGPEHLLKFARELLATADERRRPPGVRGQEGEQG